jgi:hypothetical protein
MSPKDEGKLGSVPRVTCSTKLSEVDVGADGDDDSNVPGGAAIFTNTPDDVLVGSIVKSTETDRGAGPGSPSLIFSPAES